MFTTSGRRDPSSFTLPRGVPVIPFPIFFMVLFYVAEVSKSDGCSVGTDTVSTV